jgi:hypothetical protein
VEDYAEQRVVKYAGSLLRVSVTPQGMLKCPLCGALFASDKDLLQHLIAHAMDYIAEKRKPPERN